MVIFFYDWQSSIRTIIFKNSYNCLAKPNCAQKLLQIPPFCNNNAILACTLNFCHSLIWLSIVGLLLAITVYIISNIKISIALAKDYLHRCCYGQYLSKFCSVLSSNHFASLQTKKDNCIPQHYARVFSFMGMIDLNTVIVCNVSVGCQIALIFFWSSNLPFWFELLVCWGNLHKEVVKALLYTRRIRCVFSFWGQVLGVFMLWIRLKPIYFNVCH